MANYYTFTSMGFPISPREKDFLEKVSAGIDAAIDSGEYDDDAVLEELPSDPFELGKHLVACSADPGVNIDIDSSGSTVVISDEGDGNANPNSIALMLGAMLSDSESNDVIGFQYANTCSQPRVDSFGGGAVAVSQDLSREENTLTTLTRLSHEVLKETQGLKGVIRNLPTGSPDQDDTNT